MPAANAVKRRVAEKHRVKAQKAKAKRKGIDTSDPFWKLLFTKASTEAPSAAARPARPVR